MPTKKGLIYVFTGNGKGKTSAALGIAVRAVCAGLKVVWISWYKNPRWPISEKKLSEFLPIDFYLLGKGFYINQNLIDNSKTYQSHRKAALVALEKTRKLLKNQKPDLLICDEINNAVADKLLTLKEINGLLKLRGKTHLVLTGRRAKKEIVTQADLVTEMKEIKHYYQQGKAALQGLDF